MWTPLDYQTHNFIDTDYTFYGNTIHKAINAKYLGNTFDCNLICKSHINRLAAKANAIQAILQKITTFCPTEVKICCYNTFAWLSINILLLPGHHIMQMIWLNLRKFSAELLDSYTFNDYFSFMVFLPCWTINLALAKDLQRISKDYYVLQTNWRTSRYYIHSWLDSSPM